MRTQYRVRWKRAGRPEKTKRFMGAPQLRRFLLLLGPEPWRAYRAQHGDDPDNPNRLWCCCGRDCECEGRTVKQEAERKRAELDLPPIQWIRVESRQVTPYEPCQWPAKALAEIANVETHPEADDADYSIDDWYGAR